MTSLLPVMFGGALGAALRYLTAMALGTRLGASVPYATLAVNLAGGFAMGVLAALVMRGTASEGVRLFIGVGVLGGFTTFSAFSLESFQMIERGQWGLAGGYALASVIGSVLMLGAGMLLAKTLIGSPA